MTNACHLAAAAVYLAVSLWVIHPVLPVIDRAYPCWSSYEQTGVSDGDQSHMIWATSRNARTFATAPWRLWDFEVCHPFPNAVALGHHLYAEGLLGMVPYALTREPILTFNLLAILMLWTSAMGMYALAYHWTGSPLAAFVAGVLFQVTPIRLIDSRWPSIVGNQWTPPALLFAHRLFDRGRWRDAAGLALFVGLQVLESFYQVIPLVVLGLVYGVHLLVRYRRRLGTLWPKLAAVGGVVAVVTAVVMSPYVEIRAAWPGLEGRTNLLPWLHDLAPGNTRYPGTVLLTLAAVGLLDRLRGRRGDDPRVVYVVAGCVLLSCMIVGIVAFGVVIPSLALWAGALVPGLESVRGIQFGIVGVALAPALLAAYGVLALTERMRPPAAAALVAGLAAAALAEAFHPTFATASFGAKSLGSTAFSLSVPRDAVAFARDRLVDGAVLDLPADQPPFAFGRRAHYTLMAAFHRHPIAASFTSFPCPLGPRVEALAARLPDRRAALALHALGFRNVVVHEELVAHAGAAIVGGLAVGDPRLVLWGRVEQHGFYRLESAAAASGDRALLAAGAKSVAIDVQDVGPGVATVRFAFENGGNETYRQPDPIELTPAVVRWLTPMGEEAARQHVRVLLPLALAPGDRSDEELELPVPPGAGRYRVMLAAEARPEVVLAVGAVEVTASSGTR